jgi:hypothetical protein
MEQIRARFDAAEEVLARETWRFRVGRVARLDLSRVDDEFGDVTGGDLLDAARREEGAAAFESGRDAWSRLRRALECAFVSRRTRDLERELLEREVQERISIAGTDAPLFAWQLGVARERDVDARRRIQDAIDAAQERLSPLRRELFVQRGELLASLGYASRRAFAEAALPELDLDAWGRSASELLDRTEGRYQDGLRALLGDIGVEPGRATPADEARLGLMPQFAERFPAGKRGDLVGFATAGLGVPARALGGIEFDLESRRGKQPRPLCVAAQVPGEIYVSVSDTGGVDSVTALLHQTGRALQLAFTSPELPVERRRVGDPAVSELWGSLLSARLADPAWFADLIPSPALDAFERAARHQRLARLRRVAARVSYALELASQPAGSDPHPLAERFADALSRATGCHYRASGYLTGDEEPLYAVHELRAACLEARISELLRLEFGERFWRERRAGDLLKELWNTGCTYTADELASELGVGPIDVAPLIEAIGAG